FTYGGDCVGSLPDGRAVFVPDTLPGETVEIELIEEKRSYARGRALEILDPSPSRVQPFCHHFGACGGCHYQHMGYADQLAAKKLVLKDQFAHIAGIVDPPVEDVIPAPQTVHYRNSMQFHVDGGGEVGFRARASNTIIPVTECFLPVLPIQEIWPQFHFRPAAFERRFEVRCGTHDEIMLVPDGDADNFPELKEFQAALLADRNFVSMTVLEKAFRVSSGSFFQVNIPVAEAIIRHLQQSLPFSEEMQLLDLYSGVGLFSRFFAAQTARTAAVELSASACSDYAINLADFPQAVCHQGSAEKILPRLRMNFDQVIVDPPRAGLMKRVLETLIRMGPQRIAYVSCDPSTLARDVRRLLAAGYQLDRITPFDMFPHTYHVETVVLLSRKIPDDQIGVDLI
ncbi:MAG: class I SAM-dependent RNA methyltransferase, partial [Flexilinea flocculi]|nr:class I SAM-dependent RNA methyltransferase [Flexilinea flocculi]